MQIVVEKEVEEARGGGCKEASDLWTKKSGGHQNLINKEIGYAKKTAKRGGSWRGGEPVYRQGSVFLNM